jgi:sigma-B regulation protein RsbU (phosphoserine phosphatase)
MPEEAPVTIAAVLESFCHLSGDLFGWRLRSDGNFLLWIADMSGHGLETGLASAVLKVLIDELSKEGGVEGLAAELNETMIRCVRPGGRMLFATGFFMTLGRDGSATFCSAGHPPALLIGPGRELRELGATSRPIGLFQDQPFRAEQIRLVPGETLFLYTDGLIELTPLEGEQFGPEQLRAFLREPHGDPLALTGSLYESIAAVHDLKKLDDDVTFVAARMLET